TETALNRELLEHMPEPAAVVSKKTIDPIGLTIVRFANGVEAWLKPTDFKNDQILFAMQGKGGSSRAPQADFFDASFADAYVSLSGAAGLKAVDLQKLLAGKIANAGPFTALSTDGFHGSAASGQLETALQLLYARFTEPGDDPDAFTFLKQQLTASIANRLDNPETVFADKVDEVNTSNNYTARPLTVADVNALDRSKMSAFYRREFSNAADFTFFMVGSFSVDEAVPLLARYVGGLPSTGHPTATFKNVGIAFPGTMQHATVTKGKEPKSETVISFYAEPPADDPMEQERVLAATDVLETDLRDILREDLGQTYTVSVGIDEMAPQTGGGRVEVTFGAAPENIDRMIDRVMQEVRKFRDAPPSADLLNRAKQAALNGYQTQLKQNAYWLQRFETVQLFGQDPAIIPQRAARIDALTAQGVQDAFKKYFPIDRGTIVTLMPDGK
ncbi:MAG TPA: insulinase family protein, partial [Vicinamibacterales bacterium]